MAQDEKVLIDRFCNGDNTAFHELVDRYKKKVYYIAYDITGDHNDAEDISQEVFIKVFRSIKTFRRDAKMSSWLYQITVNTSIDSLRKKSSKPQKAIDDLGKVDIEMNPQGSSSINVAPERSAEASIIQAHISRALQRVTPKERSVFVMRHYNDLKLKEIAEILNVSVGTVKALLFRVIKKLQKELSFYRSNTGLEASYE